MLLGISQFPLKKIHCNQGFENILITINSAQHNLTRKSEADRKYFIHFPKLNLNKVVLIYF